tara:strand:+ start:6197 stop:6859 length:663 start_codon:yes stop_codon:yes gene_type:complete
MDYLQQIFQFFLHVDKHLAEFVSHYGNWVFALLFVIIFCETGLIITPFLPGDSLLFAAGSIAAISGLHVHWLAIILVAAAILGDTVNYWIGHWLGPKIFHYENSRLLNKKHLRNAHNFYERHGGKAVIIARFIPIVRTFIPFIAGMASMEYRRFIVYNVTGAFLWVYLFLYVGYYFGNLPAVANNFTLVIMAIIVISVMPPVIEYLRHRWLKKSPASEGD